MTLQREIPNYLKLDCACPSSSSVGDEVCSYCHERIKDGEYRIEDGGMLVRCGRCLENGVGAARHDNFCAR